MSPHGTVSRYTNYGCRCDECKRVKVLAHQELKVKRHLGTVFFVSPARSREHLLELQRQGMGCRAIADITDLGYNTLVRIRGGKTKRVHPRTEEKILAVEKLTYFVRGGQTKRLLKKILDRGYRQRDIAYFLGREKLQIARHRRVKAQTELEVSRIYRMLEAGKLRRQT